MRKILLFALIAAMIAGCSDENGEAEIYSLQILTPGDGAVIHNNDPLSITLKEEGTVQKADFYLDGNLIGSDITSPFSLIWTPEDVSAGEYELTVIGYSNSIEIVRSSIDVAMELRIGDSFQGGKIFSLDEYGHGLIAQETDLAVNNSYLFTYGGYGQDLGAKDLDNGFANTEAICAKIADLQNAAVACRDLVVNGYDDWYLPSETEIKLLKSNQNYVGGFSTNSDIARYWSSTELDLNTARAANFVALMGTNIDKRVNYRVRAIRKF